MEYFKNNETRVRRTTTGITELPDGYLSNSIVNVPVNESANPSKSIIAKSAKTKEELERKAKEKRKQINKQFNANKVEQDTKQHIFNKRFADMSRKGKATIFKRLVTEMYIQSLYLDEDFILENFDAISNIVENFVDEHGGYTLLENAYEQSKSPILKKMINICEETTKAVTSRVYQVAEKDQNADLLNFDLNSEEKEKFDYDKRDLGIEEISNVVKEKVLTVVKDEKVREQKHEELMEDIENELSDNPEVTDEKTIKESLTRMFAQVSPTEEGTLFNTLLRSNYKSVIEGTAPLFTNEFSSAEENFLVDDIDFEDADLDEEISDFPHEDEMLEDEEIFEVFDSNAIDVINALHEDTDESTEKLEESLSTIKSKIKDISKSVKSGKKAKTVKKDIRKIQKSTEELEEACKKKKASEGCKSKSTEACKKKAIESFVDGLDDVVEELDTIIDVHESALIEACESMKKTSKSGKTSKKLTLSKNDIHLPNVKFMYKVKAVKKDVGKLVKKSANTSSINKTKQVVKKNVANINDMIFKLEKSNKKNKAKKVKALESFRESLNDILPIIEENVNTVIESMDTLGLDEIAMEAYRNDMNETLEFEHEEFIEESCDGSVDMDQMLAQTIATYTLMEMCYTIKLANYRSRDIKNMTHNLLNK